MEEFRLLHQCKAPAACDEIARFWEQQGCAMFEEGPSALCTTPALVPRCEVSFQAAGSKYTGEDLLKFMETGPSNEELREWLLRPDVLYARAP